MSLASVTGSLLWPFRSGIAPSAIVAQPFRVALRAKLLSLQDVTDFVHMAIYPELLPPSHNLDAGPAISFNVVREPRTFWGEYGHVLSGSDGTLMVKVVLTVWGYDFGEVDAISTLLYQHLDGVRNATDWGNGSITIMSCIYSQEIDEALPMSNARPQLTYRQANEFFVRYRPLPLPDSM